MTIVKKETHIADMLDSLISQYKDQPIWIAVITAFAQQIQDLEDAVEQMQNLLDISLSEGVQLDRIGRILNESRGGNTDASYRMYLTAAILVNKSNGTADEIMNIMYLLTETEMNWTELYTLASEDDAQCRIQFLGPLDPVLVDVDRLSAIAQKAKPSGVNLHLDFYPPTPFTWDTANLGWDEGLWGGGN